MNDDIAAKIAMYLKIMASIQAANYIHDYMDDSPKKEKIVWLDQLGFVHEEIANLVGSTVGTVKKEISVNKGASRGDA